MSVGRMSGLRLFVQDSGYTSQIRIAAGPFVRHGNLSSAMEIYADFYLAFATPWNPCRRDRVLSHGNGMGLSAHGKDPAAVSPGGGHRGAC